MREGYRFQIRPEYRSLVHSLLAAGTNSLMKGTVRIGEVGDENYRRIRDLQETLQQKNGQELFARWRIDRSYSAEEIEGAELFLIKIPFTHLAAEEYGALYLEQGEVHFKQSHDEFKEVVKRFSSFGKVPTRAIEQTSLLRLPVYKLPTRKDLMRIWGGELIVSERFAALVQHGAFTGGMLFPVLNARSLKTQFAQLVVQSSPLETSEDCCFGDNVFNV